jgi:integrase
MSVCAYIRRKTLLKGMIMAGTGSGLILRNKIYHLRFSVKGHIVAESTHTGNLREAERYLARRKAEVVQELVLAGNRPVKLYSAIDEYIASRQTPSSKRNSRLSLKPFKDLIEDKLLKKVEMYELDEVIEAQRSDDYAESVIALRINTWNSFANWCATRKYSICGKMKNLYVEGKVRWLTLDEEKALLEAISPDRAYHGKSPEKDAFIQDNQDLIIALLDTGARYNEIASLRWNQVDLEKCSIHINRSKGGKDTIITITDRLWDILDRRYGIDKNLVFPTKMGKNNNSRWMAEAVKRAGLSETDGTVTIHIMRHTAASRWIQNGMNLVEVAYLLGHHSVTVTQRYAHLVPSDASAKAASILNKLQR